MRREGSYIYEEFMPTGGTDVKVVYLVLCNVQQMNSFESSPLFAHKCSKVRDRSTYMEVSSIELSTLEHLRTSLTFSGHSPSSCRCPLSSNQ